jgi:hypothetical protein
MVILCFFGVWVLYIWLVQKCIRSAAGIKAGDRCETDDQERLRRVQIPDAVPSEWIEAYRAENDA